MENLECCFHEGDKIIMTILKKRPSSWFLFKYDQLLEDLKTKYEKNINTCEKCQENNRGRTEPDQDLTTDYDTTLYFKHSFLINPDINDYNKDADFRMDNYQIDHILDRNILYYDFFRLITPNIIAYILKTSPNDENPIKYTFIIHDENEKRVGYIKNIKAFSSDLVIYLPNTLEIDRDSLINKINVAIDAENYTNHDWIFSSDSFNTLTIIQEKPRYYREPNISTQTKLGKTFKEDKCVVCFDNKPNVLFCDCGHLIVCEECFNKSNNKNKCLNCREVNKIIRKV